MSLRIDADVADCIYYMYYSNGDPVIPRLVIYNEGEAVDHVVVSISSRDRFLIGNEIVIERIGARESVDIAGSKRVADLDPNYFARADRDIESAITIRASAEGTEPVSLEKQVRVLVFDRCPGIVESPESIAAFVRPGSGDLAQIRRRASEILGKQEADLSSESGRDAASVKKTAEALYAAVSELGIRYSLPPTDFESNGEIVRSPRDILADKSGTCIEMAVLFASLLESVRLRPLVFFCRGHAFAGVRLTDSPSPKMVDTNCSSFRADVDEGDLCVFECEAGEGGMNFSEACRRAYGRLLDADSFLTGIDISLARAIIRPMPSRVLKNNIWVIEDGAAGAEPPADLTGAGQADRAFAERNTTTFDRWKNDLLDLSARNNLLNAKVGKKVVPLLVADIGELENKLADGQWFDLKEKPQEWDGASEYGKKPLEAECYIGNAGMTSAGDLNGHVLRTALPEEENNRALRLIGRQFKQFQEESGFNALHITLGMLRWRDTKRGADCYAPLIMLPVEIKKAYSIFRIKALDEDTTFNVTLSEKLRKEYGIDLGIPDPLPADDHGVDVEDIISRVRSAVRDQDGWEVFSTATLGIYSFGQYVIWKDLDTNIDEFRKNRIVDCLLESKTYGADQIETDADPYDFMLVLPADGSQIKAVSASRGHSFVMHGPPGTGKSQTITNIIADSLYRGKTVLFVAEKIAALQVVKKRLDECGIGNHCLELHSNKSEKSKVIEQLKNAMSDVEKYDDSELEELKTKLGDTKKILDDYAKDLYRPVVAGLDAFDLISEYDMYDTDTDADIAYAKDPSSAEKQDIDGFEMLVRESYASRRRVSDIDPEVFGKITVDTPVATLRSDLVAAVEEVRQAADGLEAAEKNLKGLCLPFSGGEPGRMREYYSASSAIGDEILGDPGIADHIRAAAEFRDLSSRAAASMSSVAKGGSVAGAFADAGGNAEKMKGILGTLSGAGLLKPQEKETLGKLVSDYSDAAACAGRISEGDLAEVARYWNVRVLLSPESAGLAARYEAAANAGFFKKRTAKKEFLSSVAGFLLDPNTQFDQLERSVKTVSSDENLRGLFRAVSSYSGASCPEADAVAGRLNAAAEVSGRFGIGFPEMAEGRKRRDEFGEADRACSEARKSFEDACGRMCALAGYVPSPLSAEDPVAAAREACGLIRRYIDRIGDMALWSQHVRKLKEAGLGDVVDEIDDVSEQSMVNAVYRAFYKAALEYCRMKLPSFSRFGESAFESSIRRFRDLDMQYMLLCRSILKCHLWQNLPRSDQEATDGSELYMFNKALSATRLRKTIRQLISDSPNIIRRVCPCMLMSPLSVSQYLSADFPKFDIVIFDESSQVTTPKAVGAIGRGLNAVIAGDSKQLPPTSFFKNRADEGDDPEAISLDSLLDDCLALDMPETYLQWHYRSRHESLIAFSNRMYYNNSLLTFPSSDDGETKVSCVFVSDGVYERGSGINRPEAKRVVDEIYRRVMDDEQVKKSIGVISFSVRQQSCIQDELDDRLAADKEFFDRFESMEEEVFIKNLETVQGDERDTILFSIGYGPNKNGVVYQNFGPINQEGGARRLNVAVSRARCEMVVFTSMHSTDVKCTGTSPDGVRSLHDFLRFAENGGRFDNQDRNVPKAGNSNILRSIAGELRANGYVCHFGVGASKFSVDIAVVDPDDPEKYILGILSDGSYRGTENSRDREFKRADVLRGLGWNIARVWSVEWYEEPDSVIRRLVSTLEDIKAGRYKEEVTASVPAAGEGKRELMSISDVPEHAGREEPYAPSRFVRETGLFDERAGTADIAQAVIAAEWPIDEEYLIWIVAQQMGIRKLTDQTRKRMTAELRRKFNPEISGDGEFVTYYGPDGVVPYEKYRTNPDTKDVRKFEYISRPEIAAACLDVVEVSGSIAKESVPVAVARKFGFKRTGERISKRVMKVLEMEIAEGRLAESEGRISVPDGN